MSRMGDITGASQTALIPMYRGEAGLSPLSVGPQTYASIDLWLLGRELNPDAGLMRPIDYHCRTQRYEWRGTSPPMVDPGLSTSPHHDICRQPVGHAGLILEKDSFARYNTSTACDRKCRSNSKLAFICPSALYESRKEVTTMVTYAGLFSFCLLIIGVIDITLRASSRK